MACRAAQLECCGGGARWLRIVDGGQGIATMAMQSGPLWLVVIDVPFAFGFIPRGLAIAVPSCMHVQSTVLIF